MTSRRCLAHLSLLRGGFLLAATLLGSGHCQLSAQSPTRLSEEQQALLKRVDEHYNHLGSLRARYVERYSGMGLTRVESGTLLLKKPGRMRWAYDTPAGKVFVLDGKYAWFYTPGDLQVQRIPARQVDDLRTPLRFLLGHTQLARELDDIGERRDGASVIISGVPRGMANRVRQLSLRVTDNGAIVAMKLEELDGATTEFSFTDLQENVPTADADFHFTVPAGITVIEGAKPI